MPTVSPLILPGHLGRLALRVSGCASPESSELTCLVTVLCRPAQANTPRACLAPLLPGRGARPSPPLPLPPARPHNPVCGHTWACALPAGIWSRTPPFLTQAHVLLHLLTQRTCYGPAVAQTFPPSKTHRVPEVRSPSSPGAGTREEPSTHRLSRQNGMRVRHVSRRREKGGSRGGPESGRAVRC